MSHLILPIAAPALIGYALGSIPFGLLLTRAAGLGDIRKVGSGNIGATNVLRTGHKGLAAATVLLDGGKGALAVLIAARLGGDPGMAAAGIGAALGHMFPLWLRFRGGKGVATGFGVLLAAAPMAAAWAALAWLATLALTRISSASALMASLAAPAVIAALGYPRPLALMALVIAALIWQRHRGNIGRLIAGTEPKIGK